MRKLQAAEDLSVLLRDFRVVEAAEGERISLGRFSDPDFLGSFLETVGPALQTDEARVAGSQLVKRLGYLLTLPALFAAASADKLIPVRTGFLVPAEEDGKWLPKLLLPEPAAADRINDDQFRAYTWDLFAGLAPIVRAVSEAANVPRPVLWENIAIYVYWLYEKKLADCSQAAADFQWLLHGLPGEAFGERRNPLKTFYREKPEGEVRTRKTCCFYYEGAGCGSYCGTCPKK
ncbi:(2Fe-2S)-binding protein [Indiicoccus explosivorum]|uniref:(2Fe-2S)-binding protein n=1 Tax=Indiicoccus explosivorum TaxID=1917864 RepID=UPI000B43F7E1|nr:(2Fe-2S)-binding protein [Indiicoccus explosivorum]